MIAMILAAGRGERLRPITDSMPKALVKVQGQSLLERHLWSVRAAGIETVVINLGWLGEQIEASIGSGARFGLQVVYSQEGDNILETGGGIQRALPLFGDEPFLVVNGDVFTDIELPVALSDDADGHLVMVPTPDFKTQGDFELVDGLVRNATSPALTFSGVATYRPSFFKDCEPGRFSVAPMLRRAADAGRLTGNLHSGLWEDVGTPERLERVNQR